MRKRLEKDSLGAIEVPAEAHWGAQTARSILYFNIGGSEDRVPLPVIYAFGYIKKAAALVNGEMGLLAKEKADLIVKAADEVIAGKLDDQFPLSIWQTGSGTQTNMNLNEVIASRSNELAGFARGSKSPVHPSDDVNMSQSSNDTFPTAMHIAAVERIHTHLVPSLKALTEELTQKSSAFHSIIKMGRTHLMDALPLTLGQEFSGYVAQLKANLERIENALPHLYELAIGATAVGTGFLSPPGFGEKVASRIAQFTGFPFISARNKFAALSSHDALVAMSGILSTLAGSLTKIATDLAWMCSGPRCSLGELSFPANELGSSIMPGKINPTQCEALLMIADQVRGLDTSIAIAGSRGNFELNVFKPLIIRNLLRSSRLLADAMHSFANHFVKGLKPNEERLKYLVERSLMLATALRPHLGYDKTAEVALKAYREDLTLKEACLQLQLLTAEQFDALVDPTKMV